MNSRENDNILIGKIKYTNAWPVYHHFNVGALSRKSELVTEVPSVLNRGILDGSLDIAPVSSFAFGVGADRLLLLPDLSVSSDGPVNSILLFSRKPPEEMKEGTIALTNTSATSVNLLKIIMQKAYGLNPTYSVGEPDLDQMMAHHDAALLIGDHAIRASWRDHGYIVTDLGDIWKKWTGYGMSFAVWTVQRSFAEANPEFLSEVCTAFKRSKQQSLNDLSSLVSEACREIGGTADYWHHYFNNLCYDFNDKQQAGLALYFAYAYELGLLQNEVRMDIWSDNTLTRVK
ncbi:ABC transporter substrate-binding protein [Paenibacillus anaericanus]|uniref:Chorismate dehydratase n=1 Tax=Paenibacillus anaericanus TaxID=170367 RepID=A0A3S1BR97_9BACL|nr:menaquinone biosynthesis protein [Paenibacillus anaericanus]RUT47672.1 ABC transporter substrate-binding protein [Paenibacillus anaericanus]